jgi:ketosteroid isomerase-like protein
MPPDQLRGTMIHTPTGQGIEFETLDVLTVADGKIIDFLEFLDTHRLARIISGED